MALRRQQVMVRLTAAEALQCESQYRKQSGGLFTAIIQARLRPLGV